MKNLTEHQPSVHLLWLTFHTFLTNFPAPSTHKILLLPLPSDSKLQFNISKEALLSPARRKTNQRERNPLCARCVNSWGCGTTVRVYTNKYNPHPPPPPGWTAAWWCSDWKRTSISSGITVITLYDSTAVTTNYHRESVLGEKTTSRVIHCMLLTAAVRYLKPLFSSALMGVELSFALWVELSSQRGLRVSSCWRLPARSSTRVRRTWMSRLPPPLQS